MLGLLGRRAIDQAHELTQIVMLPYAACKGAILERGRGRRLVVAQTASQIYFTAVEPLPIFLLIAVSCGFCVTVLADFLMRSNGLAPYVPAVVAQATVRELLPIVIAVVLVGRSGTAIATELGYMRVNQEIEALDVTGINLDYFLVLPRIVGLTVASISLTIALSGAGLLGGFLVGKALHLVSGGLRFGDILGALTPATLAFALVKAALFGVAVSSINCFHGLAVGRSFTEIPRANARGSVQCYLACFFLDAVLLLHALRTSL